MRDLNRIKQIPIPAYLEQRGIRVPARGNICAFWRDDHNPSVSIDRAGNRWYDHGTGLSGSIVDLVMAIERCSFTEALDILDDGSFSSVVLPQRQPVNREPAIIIEDILDLSHPALLSYLHSRYIPVDIARHYCREVHYHLQSRPQSHYFAVGFENKSGGWELRNAYTKLATGKDYSIVPIHTSIRALNNIRNLAIFEGFTDFLSCLSIDDSIIPIKVPETALILNSVALVRDVLKDFREGRLGRIQSISFFTDNDDAGRKAARSICAAASDLGIDIAFDAQDALVEHGAKDINDLLIKLNQR